MSQKTVFISYRRDATGKAFARLLKQELTHRGYDVFLDVDCLDAGQWKDQILTQVPKRAHFLLLLTPGALDRCADEGDWVRRELLLAQKRHRNIVPVREESVDIVKMRGSADKSMKSVFDFQIAAIQHNTFASDIETLVSRFIHSYNAPVETTSPTHSFQPDISRIIKYAPAALIGRETETQLLNDVWYKAGKGESKRPHVLTFVALGGEGKTSLVAKWVAELAQDDWSGCEAVFAWSFYSQGTKEQTMASSDLFLKEALVFFGDEEIANSALHASDKGKRLAQLVGEKRALLILDGVEPLQYAPTSPTPGELKDDGLAGLLKGLAASSHGLCVVTTRYSIPDLKVYWQGSAPQITLKRLSKKAGVALLKSFGVNGTQIEFEKLVEDVRGHALTLNLLGSYLCDAHAGDIRKRDLVTLVEADAEEQGGHAFRVMDAYVQWFETGGKDEEENKKGQRALAVLRLLGLFDRPMTADCFAVLLKAPAIPNLTEPLVGLSDSQRNLALTRLDASKLLTVNRDAGCTLLALDTHPLLREYFAKRIREQHPNAWKEGHQQLYLHLSGSVPYRPEGLDGLQPLYQAVAHGCQAGSYDDALKVYRDRILRGFYGEDAFYSTGKLGAISADLAVLACFFDVPWSSVTAATSVEHQAWLLNDTGWHLMALGRLVEALEPLKSALDLRERNKNWIYATGVAFNMSELEQTLGDLNAAESHARRAVELAVRSNDASQQSEYRAALADLLHQKGQRDEASEYFSKAEAEQPENRLLLSRQGFWYCDLLLAESERASWQQFQELKVSDQRSEWESIIHKVEDRAKQTLLLDKHYRSGLVILALEHLTLGRIALYQSVLKTVEPERTNTLEVARRLITSAVDGLRAAGTIHELPRGLLTRAWLRSLEGKHTGPDNAQADLDEAWEIAERGPMPLFMADICLHRARLFFRVTPYPWNNPDGTPRSAKDDLIDARQLIEKHGYWRRKEELEDAELVIGK